METSSREIDLSLGAIDMDDTSVNSPSGYIDPGITHVFEMFNFVRVFYGEYHYLDGLRLIILQHINAKNRWPMSATPGLEKYGGARKADYITYRY